MIKQSFNALLIVSAALHAADSSAHTDSSVLAGGGANSMSAFAIPKRVFTQGSEPAFRARLLIPLQGDSKVAEDPITLEVASDRLLAGLDPSILNAAVDALRSACALRQKCDVYSEEFWDLYFGVASKIQVEDGYSLSSYLERLYQVVAELWGLDGACDDSRVLCMALNKELSASGEIFAELIFRKAILSRVGMKADLSALADGMGDLVDKQSTAKAE